MDETDDLFQPRVSNLEYRTGLIDFNFVRNFASLIELLSPYQTKLELVRLGRESDGGYVVAQLPIKDLKFQAITLGVGDEITADQTLLSQGYTIFAVDGTVDNPLQEDIKFHFHKSNIGYKVNTYPTEITYEKLLHQNDLDASVDLLMIDIEGSEYQLLSKELEKISKARQIVVEFHGLELLGDNDFLESVIRIFIRMNETHQVVHIHGNNSGSGISFAGTEWPSIIEVTFLQKKYCKKIRNYGPFPGKLDYPNSNNRPDIDLNPFFSEVPTYLILSRRISKLWEM
jgi:hypothetical protein